MPLRHLSRMALPLVFALMTLVPPLGVLLTGRNLDSFASLEPLEPSTIALWIFRLASVGSVLALLAVVVHSRILSVSRPVRPPALALFIALLIFFTTNVLSPGYLAPITGIPRSYYYVLLLFLALYATHREGGEWIILSAKWCLLAFMLGSLLISLVMPGATLRAYQEELRLPLVPFRFWGLGSGPNSIGPLAFTLLLLTITYPFHRRWVHWTALASASTVMLLSQSQTTWIAAALILPPLHLYRRQLRQYGTAHLRLPPGLILAATGFVLAAVLLAVALAANSMPDRVALTGGISEAEGVLTGRGHIWSIALDTFANHPLFGYGLEAWEAAFRAAINMSFAVHAHNQLMQSLSVAGVIGAAGLAVYFVVLSRESIRVAAATGGLAPALMTLTLLRCITEVPFQMASLLVGDTLMHALLFAVIVTAAPAAQQGPASLAGLSPRQPARQHGSETARQRSRGRRPTIAAE